MGARHFGVGQESTYGTEVTPTVFFEALSESVQNERNYESIETIRSFSVREMALLTSSVKGEVEILGNYLGMGILFENLLGNFTTNASGADYTHVFPNTIPTTDRIGKSLTLEFRRDGDLSWRYLGCKPISMSHTMGTDQSSRLSVGFLGKAEGTNATATASYPTLSVLKPSQVTTITIGGVSATARQVTVDVENPLDEPFALGSTALAAEPDRNGVLRVTGSAELFMTNMSFSNLDDGSTDQAIVIASVNNTHSLTYTMNKCRITQSTPHNSGRDRLIQTVTWEAFYNAAADENFQIQLVNSDASW